MACSIFDSRRILGLHCSGLRPNENGSHNVDCYDSTQQPLQKQSSGGPACGLRRSRSSLGSENCAPGTAREPQRPCAAVAPPAVSALSDVTNAFVNGQERAGKAFAKAGRGGDGSMPVTDLLKKRLFEPLETRCSEQRCEPLGEPLQLRDPQEAAEYAADVHELLRRTQSDRLPQSTYMDGQPNVNLEMRAILVDWLVDVHRKYKCQSRTLFLTVALLDRYLEKNITERKQLQLFGVAAMLVASKFEERCPPHVKDFVHITDKTYTAAEIRDKEVVILSALDFRVCQPIALDFLPRVAQANGSSVAEQHLAQYLLELTLLRPLQLQHSPCRLVAAAVLLAARLCRRDTERPWSAEAARCAEVEKDELEPSAQEMWRLLAHAEKGCGKLRAVAKKFADEKFSAVAKTSWAASAATSQW